MLRKVLKGDLLMQVLFDEPAQKRKPVVNQKMEGYNTKA